MLRLHNFAYQWSSFLAAKAEGGLHPKHRLMNYHQFFVDNVESSDSVLDIGCGNGALTFDVAQKAQKVVGIDIKEKNIALAKEKYSADNLEYITGDATKFNSNVGGTTSHIKRFDVIVLSNVLEHIENRVEFLESIKNLAPKILIRVPMMNRDWITLYKKEVGVRWMLDVTHQIEYTEKSFRKEMEGAGLKVDKYSVQFGEIWAVIKNENS